MPVLRRGLRGLLVWCQRVTDGYDGVNVIDLSTSFKNGLAFCAILHHFRPDLIPWDSLTAEDVVGNCELAFRVAEEELDVPSLLDPQDMLECQEPDRFSVATYVSQLYHALKDDQPGSPSARRDETDSAIASSSSESTPLGTPTATPKRLVLNQSDLIAKYGEEIFSSSSKSSSTKMAGIASVCRDVMKKATLSDEKES